MSTMAKTASNTRRHAAALPAPRSRGARARYALDALTAVLFVIALGVFAWPAIKQPSAPASGTSTMASAEPAATTASTYTVPTPDMTRLDSLALRVVSTNVFSAARKAPAVRFVPPGQAGTMRSLPTASDGAGMADSAANIGSIDGETFPRLSGIVVMNGERMALLQLSASDGAPRLYRAGEQHGRVRVVRIDASRVLLSGPAGSRVLRLDARATPDSLETLP